MAKIKTYLGTFGGWLLALFGMLTYIFMIKEGNRDLIEGNSTLKAELGVSKDEAAADAAGKDADAKEDDFNRLNAEYSKQSSDSGPKGNA